MKMRMVASLSLGILLAMACHDSKPASEPASGERKETELNRVHREVKENVGEAAEKVKNAGESVHEKIHRGAEKAGTELGVRPAVVDGHPHGDAGAR